MESSTERVHTGSSSADEGRRGSGLPQDAAVQMAAAASKAAAKRLYLMVHQPFVAAVIATLYQSDAASQFVLQLSDRHAQYSDRRENARMDALTEFLNEIGWQDRLLDLLTIVLILILAWLTRLALRKAMDRTEDRLVRRHEREGEPPSEVAKRVSTIMKLVRQAVSMVFWGIVFLIVLREVGVNIGPILAGAGILGLAVGFGAQNLVRDIISGLFMLLEDQVRVGDVAIINGTGGLVEEVNFRTLVLRDLGGVVHVFPNGSISSLSNMTHDWSAYIFEIGVAYKEDTDKVVEVMEEVGAGLREDEYFGNLILEDLEIFGVDKFDSSSVVIKARLKTKPVKQWEVGRQYLRRLKYAFDERDIEIPFPHQSLYFGEASRPIELKLVSGEEHLAAASAD